MRRKAGMVVAMLVASACTTVSDPAPEPVDRLLVIDVADAATMAPDGTARVDLDPGDGSRFFQGAWSSDGSRVALSGQAEEGPFLAIYPAAATTTARLTTASLPFYLYWEPGGDRVAYLANGAAGIDLRLVTDDPTAPTEELAATGQPYYFDWDPNGGRMVVHVGESRLDVVEPGLDAVPVAGLHGAFQAPQWTPDGARVLHVIGGQSPRIVLTDPTEELHETVDGVDGFPYFSMDPTGRRVAVTAVPGDPGPVITTSLGLRIIDPNTMSVVDLEEGTVTSVGGGPAVAFWWSPSGDALLFATVDDAAAAPLALRWHLWDGDTTTDLERFTPSDSFLRNVLPFIDQYNRSMTLWSPDGTRFAYPGAPEGELEGIWVFDVAAGTSRRVADGIFVAWSPR